MPETEGSRPMPKRISPAERQHFDREGFSGDIYVNPEDGLGFSALMVDVHGKHPRKKMIDATRSYLVINGTGTFTLNGETQEVRQGDLFIIPAGGNYEYQGTMTLFEFNVPGTTSANSVTLEE